MKAYPSDLCERVAAAYAEVGHTQAQVAVQFQVSASFVAKLLRYQCLAGTTAARPANGGAPPLLTAAQKA